MVSKVVAAQSVAITNAWLISGMLREFGMIVKEPRSCVRTNISNLPSGPSAS